MLLMIDTSHQRTSLPTVKKLVPPNSAGSIEVRQGQLLRITCLEDGVVLPLFGFAKDDSSVFLSVHHTRVFSNSYVLGQGMRLVSNRRRPLMVLGKDTVGRHDLLMPASTTADLKAQGHETALGCVESVQAELAALGQPCSRLPDPVNLFMNVQVCTDGRLLPQPCTSRNGDSIVCRVVRDMVFVVSTCDTGIAGNAGMGAVELAAAEDLSAF